MTYDETFKREFTKLPDSVRRCYELVSKPLAVKHNGLLGFYEGGVGITLDADRVTVSVVYIVPFGAQSITVAPLLPVTMLVRNVEATSHIKSLATNTSKPPGGAILLPTARNQVMPEPNDLNVLAQMDQWQESSAVRNTLDYQYFEGAECILCLPLPILGSPVLSSFLPHSKGEEGVASVVTQTGLVASSALVAAYCSRVIVAAHDAAHLQLTPVDAVRRFWGVVASMLCARWWQVTEGEESTSDIDDDTNIQSKTFFQMAAGLTLKVSASPKVHMAMNLPCFEGDFGEVKRSDLAPGVSEFHHEFQHMLSNLAKFVLTSREREAALQKAWSMYSAANDTIHVAADKFKEGTSLLVPYMREPKRSNLADVLGLFDGRSNPPPGFSQTALSEIAAEEGLVWNGSIKHLCDDFVTKNTAKLKSDTPPEMLSVFSRRVKSIVCNCIARGGVSFPGVDHLLDLLMGTFVKVAHDGPWMLVTHWLGTDGDFPVASEPYRIRSIFPERFAVSGNGLAPICLVTCFPDEMLVPPLLVLLILASVPFMRPDPCQGSLTWKMSSEENNNAVKSIFCFEKQRAHVDDVALSLTGRVKELVVAHLSHAEPKWVQALACVHGLYELCADACEDQKSMELKFLI